jgi:hypothetical protein
MPRLTGDAARKEWIKYTSDTLTDPNGDPPDLTRHVFKKQLSKRHIAWLRTILGDDTSFSPTPGDVYSNGSGTADLVARYISLTNGIKRRTLAFPDATHTIWNSPLAEVTATLYVLEGESGNWRITGRHGERNSNGVQYHVAQGPV